VNGAIGTSEEARHLLLVEEVDHRRRGTGGTDAGRLTFVADHRRHVVPVLLKLCQDVRSDETGCPGEYNVHRSGLPPPQSSFAITRLAAGQVKTDRQIPMIWRIAAS
jgi:hypothetical protein